MNNIVIVPNSLSDAIYAKIDAAIKECPCAAADREILFSQLLAYFNDHGVVPDLTLIQKAGPPPPQPQEG